MSRDRAIGSVRYHLRGRTVAEDRLYGVGTALADRLPRDPTGRRADPERPRGRPYSLVWGSGMGRYSAEGSARMDHEGIFDGQQ